MSAAARRIMRIRYYLIDDARRELARAIERHGEDHPASRAARGRFWFYAGRVPQRGATSIEAVAWARESAGSRPVWNRTQRRHAAAQASFYNHKDRYPLDTGAEVPTHEDQRVAPAIELAQGAQ